MKILDYLWGSFLVALVAYMSVFALLSIYESIRPFESAKTPEEKREIVKLIGELSWKATCVLVAVFVVVKYFSTP